jgi:Flp pilus assembly protein TadD
VQAFERGDYEQARAALEVAALESETSPYRHYLLGLTLRRVGELEGAREELTRSIELAPGQVRALVNLARVELELDQTDAAREAVDLALEHDMEFADTWHLLGRIELRTGHFEGAEVAFRNAVERDAQHSWAWNNLGFVRIQQDRFDDAIDPLLHAVSLREEAVFFNNLGVALEGIGEETAAALAFARAAGIGSEKGEMSYDRLAARAERTGTVLPSVDEALEMAPDLLFARLTPGDDDDQVEVATLEEGEPIEAAANEER